MACEQRASRGLGYGPKPLKLNGAKLRWRRVRTVCIPFNPLILNDTKRCWRSKGTYRASTPGYSDCEYPLSIRGSGRRLPGGYVPATAQAVAPLGQIAGPKGNAARGGMFRQIGVRKIAETGEGEWLGSDRRLGPGARPAATRRPAVSGRIDRPEGYSCNRHAEGRDPASRLRDGETARAASNRGKATTLMPMPATSACSWLATGVRTLRIPPWGGAGFAQPSRVVWGTYPFVC
jgi:hypothetical protein